MNLSIIGLGKLGAPMAALMAEKGHTVIGVDLNRAAVDALNRGQAPVYETDLQEWISRNRTRLFATTNCTDAVRATEATFIIVPTPSKPNGAFSLDHVVTAARSIGSALRTEARYHLVVLCSTVMPGSTTDVVVPEIEKSSGKKCGRDFGMCYNPEFIALGSVLRDMRNPDLVLIGESDSAAGELLADIQRGICENEPRIARMNFVNAEITKLAINTFVTTKISYANMLAEICESMPGADVDIVTKAVGNDSRIGHKYLKGALGYGGPCFPRDNLAMAELFRQQGLEATIAESTDRQNRHQVDRLMRAVLPRVGAAGSAAVLGLSYKANTDVIENSQAVTLVQRLAAEGVRVVVYDPAAMEKARQVLPADVQFANSAAECVQGADVVVIATPWKQFQALSPGDLSGSNGTVCVIDCWRQLRPDIFTGACEYVALGVGYTSQDFDQDSASIAA